MKTLGLIGGMSWESTLLYYRIINETVRERLGGFHSARILLYSVDFHDIERLQQAGAWEDAGHVLAQAARVLEAAGAEGLVLCTNTMHKVAPAIETVVAIPLLHIADPTAAAVKQAGLGTVGLLGTRFTLEQDFYRGRLAEQHGLTVMIPDAVDREIVHRVIYEELCLGQINPDSRRHYHLVMQRLVDAGAEGIILGCTEITLLIGPEDTPVPLFDTTDLHAREAAVWALGAVEWAAPIGQHVITRIPHAAQARRLQHEPEVDAPFMEVLHEVLPDETARLAYLNHLAWEARS